MLISILIFTILNFLLLIAIAGTVTKMVGLEERSRQNRESNLMNLAEKQVRYDQLSLMENHDGFRQLPPNYDGVGDAVEK